MATLITPPISRFHHSKNPWNNTRFLYFFVVRRETLDDVGMIHGSQDLCLHSQENHTREEGGGHKKTDWDVHGT